MTASLMRVPGSGDTLVPQACQRTLAIFDGRMRYDLQLSFKRLERVSSQRGYQGVAVVCAVRFLADCGVRSGSRCHQIPHSVARHRTLACPHRRHARDGALPGFGSDPAGSWNYAGDPVRLAPAIEQGDGQDAMIVINRVLGGQKPLRSGHMLRTSAPGSVLIAGPWARFCHLTRCGGFISAATRYCRERIDQSESAIRAQLFGTRSTA